MSRYGLILVSVSLCLIVFSACDNKYYYNHNIELDQGIWSYQDTIQFEFAIEDTSSYYDLFINIVHSPDFIGQNLYSRIFTTFPDGTEVADTISLELSNKLGSWLGKCNATSCDLDLLLQQNTRFKSPGEYKIKLEQYNRIDSLAGVQSLGFKISRGE